MTATLGTIRASLTIDTPGSKPQRIGVSIPVSARAAAVEQTDASLADTIVSVITDAAVIEGATAGRLVGDALALNYDADRAERIARSAEERAQVMREDFVEGVEHLVFGDRQHGKTWLAMRWLTEAPEGEERVLIVGTVQRAELLREQYGLARNDPRVISWRQLASHRRGRSTSKVRYGIDDAHAILADMLALQELRLLTVLTAGPGQGDTPVELGDPSIVLECDRCDAQLGSSRAGKLTHGRNGAHTAEYAAL